MKADDNELHPTVSARPRGFNGIPEPDELAEPDPTVAASHMDKSMGAGRRAPSSPSAGVETPPRMPISSSPPLAAYQ